MIRVKPWCAALVVIAALLLVGGAGAVKPEKGPIDRVVFVHYKDGAVKTSSAPLQTDAYKLWGMQWNTGSLPATFSLYPGNPYVSDNAAVAASLENAFAAWDGRTSRAMFRFTSSTSPPARADGKNDVYFAPVQDAGVIAVTEVWYYVESKEIVEADITMNTNMRWGIDRDGEGKRYTLRYAYDIRNIATHEAGHVCGLADLYTYQHRDLTMYGYGSEGEVRKISLASGDIAGLRYLYGA